MNYTALGNTVNLAARLEWLNKHVGTTILASEDVYFRVRDQFEFSAYDAVVANTFAGSLEALAVRGHLVSFGQASGPVGNWDIGRFASKSLTVSRPNYGHFTDTRERLLPHVERFFGMLRQRRLMLETPTRYPLARAADAHRDLESRRTTGSSPRTSPWTASECRQPSPCPGP